MLARTPPPRVYREPNYLSFSPVMLSRSANCEVVKVNLKLDLADMGSVQCPVSMTVYNSGTYGEVTGGPDCDLVTSGLVTCCSDTGGCVTGIDIITQGGGAGEDGDLPQKWHWAPRQLIRGGRVW